MKISELFNDEDEAKELLFGQNTKQLRNNTAVMEGREYNALNAAQRQLVERKKLRRCKPVKAKVVAHTKENSG